MNNNLIKLLSILKENEELSNKMKACTSPEEAYAFACTVADGYTKEEFVAFMEKIKNNNTSSPELTEDDLQQVSGGLTLDEWTAIGGLAASVVGAAASAV